MDTYYRRHLPHWQPGGKIFFVTFRLFGSLPKKVIDRIREDAERIRKRPSRPKETSAQRTIDDSKRIFAIYEKALDEISQRSDSNSPRWLADGRVAGIVQEAIRHRDEKEFVLRRYTIMPNHVHLLFEPLLKAEEAVSTGEDQEADEISYRSLKSIVRGLKQYTAAAGQSCFGSLRTFLAAGVLRSLGTQRPGVLPYHPIHRSEPRRGGALHQAGRLALVQRW